MTSRHFPKPAPWVKGPVCRCGVYKHLHPLENCAHPKHSFWINEHVLWRHIVAPIWWTIPRDWQYRICARTASPKRDWCYVVEAWFASDPDRKTDIDDWCDVPLPWDAGPVEYGNCYCPPPDWKPEVAS